MATCTDSPRSGRIGCGATFSGRRQHSVARVSWSQHPDGLAHETFSTEQNVDRCWRNGQMVDPRSLPTKLMQGADGVWRAPGRGEPRVQGEVLL
jgi:hypothetical protein